MARRDLEMSPSRSFILILLLICFSVTQAAGGIEISFSQDDLSIDSYYEVDDSIAVEEEASATYGSGIIDDRKASGRGHIYADQYLTSDKYRAFVQAHGSEGGIVAGGATITPSALGLDQSASLRGYDVYAYVEGWQGYNGGMGNTIQDSAVQGLPGNPGSLKTVQTLSLGSSIYSSQNTHASGLNSYAVGTAGIIDRNEGWGSFKGQGALAGVANILDPYGSIDADLYAEIVRTPVYIDPLATGHIMADSGGIAFGGALAGDLETDMTRGKIDAVGAAALTGVYGGELEANVGARTDESQCAWIDGQASGIVALQAAAAGDVDANLAKQKAKADGAIIAAGAVGAGVLGFVSGDGQVGGSMIASTGKNSAKAQGESVYAQGLLAGIGTAAGSAEARWKNGLQIGTEGSAVGAVALGGTVAADKMSARENNRGTKAKISGLSADGFLIAAGAAAYYKPLNGPFSLAGVYTGPLMFGSLADGTLAANTKWTSNGQRLKATGDVDAFGASVGLLFGIDPAAAGTLGPGADDYVDTGGMPFVNSHLKMVAVKPVGGIGKADVEVTPIV